MAPDQKVPQNPTGEQFTACAVGSIESRQGTLKRTSAQALLLRGHRDFDDLEAYRRFVAEVFGRLNARVARKFNEEPGLLKALALLLESGELPDLEELHWHRVRPNALRWPLC